MFFSKRNQPNNINTTEIVDEIENAVYEHLKPHGFRKFGRTLHRFVSDDISQVISFQSGMPAQGMRGLMCVNVGIRVPECFERSFSPVNDKKYYRESACNIRSRLGAVSGRGDTWFDLRKNTNGIIARILKETEERVLPFFDLMNSREAILAHRRDYPLFDAINSHLILLDECMIYGRLGEIEKAKERFDIYYRSVVAEYADRTTNGRKVYLKKGERIVYRNQDITAEQDGFVTLNGAEHGHIDYLDRLAKELNLR